MAGRAAGCSAPAGSLGAWHIPSNNCRRLSLLLSCRTALWFDLPFGLTAACPLGRYVVNGTQTCIDCPKGSWCPGGPFRPSAQPPVLPAAVACPPDMTTLGMRSTTDRACGTSGAGRVSLRFKPGQTHQNTHALTWANRQQATSTSPMRLPSHVRV